MKHLDLFSGIGGFALATEMVWEDVEHIFCDNEPFSQEVLKKHWPHSHIYGDIRTLTADTHWKRHFHGQPQEFTAERPHQAQREPLTGPGAPVVSESIDLLTGGFPCQPFSQAGRRLGTEDDRHLWPEMLRVIREFHPRWIIGENVGGLVTWSEGLVLEQIHLELESEGYEVQAFIIPAVAVNAPHRRDRVWIVAHSRQQYGESGRDEGVEANPSKRTARPADSKRQDKDVADTKRTGHKGHEHKEGQSAGHRGGTQQSDWNQNWAEVASRLCRMDDGLPKRLDRNPRLKALGNAIVPQVAAEIMKIIKVIDN